MENIKISIMNDRAAGLKRQRDEVQPITPCSKRLRSVVNCSTPRTASAPLWSSTSEDEHVKQSHVDTPSHSLEQNIVLIDEWDDSLLEASDNESDSPLHLTVDEIESLLEDDFGCSSKPPGLKKSTYAGSPEAERERVNASPCDHLDKFSTLTEEIDCMQDLNNYAAMAPSPRNSAECAIKVFKLSTQQSSICIAESVQKKKIVSEDFASDTIFLDVRDAPICQRARDSSSNLYVPSSTSLCMVNVAEEWSKEPELFFDCDIDHRLATRPIGGSMTTSIVNPSAKLQSASQKKIVSSESCSQTCSFATSNGKSLVAVTPLPRPAPRPFISTFELEANKNIYCDHVLMHIEGPDGFNNLEDPLQELASLLNQFSRDNQNWQHPSNYSRRNHPRFGKKPAKRCTLNQWVAKNGGALQRFKGLPATFHRSPVPDVLPFSSSKI